MFDFNNIKNKVMDSLNKAADTTKDFADKATDKAKDVSRIAKLTFEISSEKEVIRKAYSEIGRLYYETHKDDPESMFIQLCDEVSLAQENIAAKEAEISELKSRSDVDGSITVEFEHVPDDEDEDDACAGCCGCCSEEDFAPAEESVEESDDKDKPEA